MDWKLFIDDERWPASDDWVIARSSDQAILEIEQRGCPIEIAFDHDLGGDDTAMHVVRWFVDALLDQRIRLPVGFVYSVHSQNTVGVQNIHGLMRGILRHVAFEP